MSIPAISEQSALAALRHRLSEAGHRGLLVLSGDAAWCHRQAAAVLAAWNAADGLWLGEGSHAQLPVQPWSKARGWLGQELSLLVVDGFAGVDADGLAALTGTLRAGGLLLLLVPALGSWGEYADPQHHRLAAWPHGPEKVGGRFLQRLADSLRARAGVFIWTPGQALPPLAYSAPAVHLPKSRPPYAHAEQAAAVTAILHVVHGHRRRPLVLSADRGRGKSAALGIAAAQLLQQGIGPILLSGPSLDAVSQVFAHAKALLPGAEVSRGLLQWQGHALRFVAPDALLQQPHEARLLLVDEAAALPLGMLEGLLQRHARLVLASTVHGYEGSGRGFLLRFARRLDVLAPGWQGMQMHQPIRWAEGDPLDRWTREALLLDAEALPDDQLVGFAPQGCEPQWLSQDALAAQEADLAALFGLLQLAHYRTSPNDLRQLLDGTDSHCLVLRWQGQIIACALLGEEGGLPLGLAEAVARGERRLQGHLLAQSLAAHAGFAEAACLRGLRIVRLAVHPACQRRGLGGQMLQAVRARFADRDYLGASFGASVALLRFWRREGFVPLRLGLRREASSGAHALMLGLACSTAAQTLFERIGARFIDQLPVMLREPWQGLEAELVLALLSGSDAAVRSGALDEQDWRDLCAFAHAARGYEVCLAPLQRLVCQAAVEARVDALESSERQLLVQKILQQQDWQRCASQVGLSGRAEALAVLRRAVARLLPSGQCETAQGSGLAKLAE